MQNVKKYKTSSGGAVVAIAVAALMFLITMLNSQQLNGWIPWTYILLLLTGAVDAKYGIYAKFDGTTFCETKHFFYRKCIKTTDIDRIRYQPTWIFGNKMRSIYILDKESGTIKIRMANAAYQRATLAQIVNDLKQANCNMRLDKDTQQLLSEFKLNESESHVKNL